MAAWESFTRGEISELTRLIHDAREIAIDRLKSEADQLGAEDVVGVKTYIAEIGHGLVEFMAIRTAVETVAVGVASPTLPVQAIVPDKDTRIDGTRLSTGSGEFSYPAPAVRLRGPLSRPRFITCQARRRPARSDEQNQ